MTLPAPPRPSPPPLGRRPLNLHTVQQWVDEGRLPTDRVITMADLRGSDCVGRKMGWGVKLLGEGAGGFDTPLHIQVGGCRGVGGAGAGLGAGGRVRCAACVVLGERGGEGQ